MPHPIVAGAPTVHPCSPPAPHSVDCVDSVDPSDYLTASIGNYLEVIPEVLAILATI
jgi:hypothetical protein